MSQNPPPIPPQEAPESAPDKPVKKKRSLILCSWVIITGVALLALLLGWHPTCDNPLGTMSSPYSSDRWSGVPPTSGQHDAPPSEAEEHLDLGSQHLSDGRDREALECFRKATAADPDNLEAWTSLATCSRLMGLKPEARAAYEKVLQLDPDGYWGKAARGHLEDLGEE